MTEASVSAKRKRGSHAGGSADATPDLQRARIAGDGESPSLKTAEDVELAAFTRSLQPELDKLGDATTAGDGGDAGDKTTRGDGGDGGPLTSSGGDDDYEELEAAGRIEVWKKLVEERKAADPKPKGDGKGAGEGKDDEESDDDEDGDDFEIRWRDRGAW